MAGYVVFKEKGNYFQVIDPHTENIEQNQEKSEQEILDQIQESLENREYEAVKIQ